MISPEQREQRRKHVGASDVAAIVGMDPYKTAADVYHSKVSGVDGPENPAMAMGTMLEPLVLDWAAREVGGSFHRDIMLPAPDGILAVNFDGMFVGEGPPRPLEAKTVGASGPSPEIELWGPHGSAEIPDRVMLQVQAQIHVARADFAWVAAMLVDRGIDFRLYRIPRDQGVIDHVVTACARFWREHVEARVPPANCLPSLEIVRRLPRVAHKQVAVEPSLVHDALTARAALRIAQREKDEADAALLAAMGDAEIGVSEAGIAKFTTSKRKGYTVAEAVTRTLRIRSDHHQEIE